MAEGEEGQKPKREGRPGGGGRQGGAARQGGARRGQGGGAARQGGARRGQGGERRPASDGQPAGERQPRPAAHTMKLEVGGHGVELHCDTCGLVVTHLAAPQVRRAVEEAHRRHLGTLMWESSWIAVCSCGWRSGRLGQQQARDQLDEHEASVLLPAARGEAGPAA